jgi:hypothetical protein
MNVWHGALHQRLGFIEALDPDRHGAAEAGAAVDQMPLAGHRATTT